MSEPVNITGETYKCATRSGLTAYFVVPRVEPSVRPAIPPQESETDTVDRRPSPLP